MTREEKIKKRKERSILRAKKNGERNKNRRRASNGMDCPFDVEMNDSYGTCRCGGENFSDCLGDI